MQDYKGKCWEMRIAGRKYQELGRKESTGKKFVGTEVLDFVTCSKNSSTSGIEY